MILFLFCLTLFLLLPGGVTSTPQSLHEGLMNLIQDGLMNGGGEGKEDPTTAAAGGGGGDESSGVLCLQASVDLG